MISKRLHPASFSNVNSQLASIQKYPACRAHSNTNISIPNSTITTIPLNDEVFDTDTMHDNSVNPSRITIKTAGKYLITACAGFASNATERRVLFIYKNGDTQISTQSANAVSASATILNISTIVDLAVNDYVEMRVFQASGGALDVSYLVGYSPYLSVARVG